MFWWFVRCVAWLRQLNSACLLSMRRDYAGDYNTMSEVELMIRGQISTLPPDTQSKVQTALERITAVANETGEEAWILAIALLGAKMSAGVQS